MHLDLDGILEVTAQEKRTGASRCITIANALHTRSAAEIAAGQQRIRELYESRGGSSDEGWETSADEDEAAEHDDSEVVATEVTPAPLAGSPETRQLLERSRRLLDQMHPEDREAAIELHEKIEAAIDAGSASQLRSASEALEELLFFVEGQH